MNQFYRALHMPPKRLLRKVMGEKEVYTIAVRPRPHGRGHRAAARPGRRPLAPCCPGGEGWWFADPLLCHRRRQALAVCRGDGSSTGKGRLEVCELHDDGTTDDWRRRAGRRFPPFLPDGV